MPAYNRELQTFSFSDNTIKLWVPGLTGLQKSIKEDSGTPFPYWAKLWPSAIAMCRFIAANPSLIANRKVLELAAGLGLPGLLASRLAKEVIISDYLSEAIELMQESITLNGLVNIQAQQLDWYSLPPDLTAEVLLLSDINYDPSAFKLLYSVLVGFLEKGTTILLTTPQRLVAKPFIERLLPFCVQQNELEIALEQEHTFISIYVLHQ